MEKNRTYSSLRLRDLGIDTGQESVIYMRQDCHVCRAEGFGPPSRIAVSFGSKTEIATLHIVGVELLAHGEAALSRAAWKRLNVKEGDVVQLTHAPPMNSLSYVRAKAFGNKLDRAAMEEIISDITAGRYSDIHLSAFITACAGDRLGRDEMLDLTLSMASAGDVLDWGTEVVADKHCIGGLPGNRTTPIIVAIVAACGLTIPKTSSRAITSPSGTADTMEVLCPVDLGITQMRTVVEQEGGCVVWGGSVRLSPADDILIRVERSLDLDSEGQLIASVLSKKLAAGATHLVLDIPTGPTAKVRTSQSATILADHLVSIAGSLGIEANAIITDGMQPIGFGIGPSLEARDVLAVLRNEPGAPADLRERACQLADALLGTAGSKNGAGQELDAAKVLSSGRALEKFEAICEAQGGMRILSEAAHTHTCTASKPGRLTSIDNRKLARVAKMAGAPVAQVAGLELHKKTGDRVEVNEPVFTVHAQTKSELEYSLAYVASQVDILEVTEET